jgi:uncharacterized iron-regulated membrane protein
MQLLRKILIPVHRYLGIPLSFLFVLWFVSGIAMIYVGGMPQLSEEERLEHLPELDLAAVRITPSDALARAELDAPGEVTLLSVLDRPAYRFEERGGATTVFADTGELLGAVDVEAERGIAARFAGVPESAVRFVRTVERPDQWTLIMSRALPLEKFTVDDGRGTEIYVSSSDAAVALATTTRTRTLAWVATIPHWFYITPLRVNQPAWYWTVVSTSALGCVLAVLGLVLGVTQFRKSTPFSVSASIRYTGWMRWHYILGVLFGVFALTWVFSGLLSMEPFAWTSATGLELRRDTFTGGPLEVDRFTAFEAAAWDGLHDENTLKEIELRRIQDEPYYVARYSRAPVDGDAKRERLHQPYSIGGRAQPETRLIDATTLRPRHEPFSVDSLVARARAGAPDAALVGHDLLADYDAYYYSRGRQAPLPVLRLKFDDPMRTWVYIDPATSRVLASIHRFNRLERWLYNGLHSLDFGFWYDRRPLWDVGVIALCAGALASSAIGLYLGLKRLRRDLARAGSRAPRG